MPPSFLKVAHRGASGYEPENTLRSFARAVEMGADMIEMDVRCAADGELVVIHDDDLTRLTGAEGFVSETPLEELLRLDAGRGEKIPLVEQVIETVAGRAGLIFDVKDSLAVKPLAALIERAAALPSWSLERFIVSSFNHYELWSIRKLNPRLRIAPQAMVIPPEFSGFAREMGAWSVHVKRGQVTESFIREAHDHELRVLVYTVDEPAEIARLRSWGVDGIFSNFPDRL